MKTNNIIKTALFTLIISFLCLVGFFFDKKNSLDAEQIYEVFIDGKSVGYLKDDDKLYDIINTKQQEIKNKYKVSAVFFQGIKHVVVERLGAFLWREDDGRATIVLQVDAGDRQAHHGTEVKLKLREVGGMTECHHTCIVWTRTQLGEDDLALFGQEELYAPKTSARQSLGHLAGDVLGLLQGCLWNLEWLPTLTVVAALLYVSDRWAEEGRTILLGNGEESELGVEVDEFLDDDFLHVTTTFLHRLLVSFLHGPIA